jgi:HK97 family phage portal protein
MPKKEFRPIGLYQLGGRSARIGRMLRELYQAQEGKAIPYTSELTSAGGPLIGSGIGFYGSNNPYVPASSPVFARSNTPLSQREALLHSQVFGGAEPVDWIMDALNYINTSASSTNFHFENDQGDEFKLRKSKNDPADVKIVDPILKKLFDMPNPYQPWDEFLETTLIDFFLVGNAYWVKWAVTSDGRPLALYRMCPQYVRILPDQFGPAKYLYKLPGMQSEIEFTPDKVLHFKRPNPHDPYYGLGLVKGGSRAVDMELALTDSAASYYEHATIPTGVVQTERRVPRIIFNKLKQQLQSFYGGSRNTGKLLVLEAGLQWQSVSPNAADALFATMGEWSRDRVLALFNMNASLLGMGAAADGNQISGWQQHFDRKTMIPLLTKFGKAVSRGLTQPGWNLELCFEYEETQSPDEVINRANALAKTPGVKVKEVREAAGLPPSTGDPEIDEYVLNLPGPNMDSSGGGGFADRNLPGEAGRPPLPEHTRLIGLGSTGVAGGNAVVKPKPGQKAFSVEDMSARIAARLAEVEGKALAPARVHVGELSTVIPPEDKLHGTRTTSIDMLADGSTNDVLSAIHRLERGLLDSSEGKASGTMYQRVKNSPAWAAFRKDLAEVLLLATQRAYSLSDIHHTNSGLTPMGVSIEELAKEQVTRPEGVGGIVKNFKDSTLQRILKLQRSGATPGEFTQAIMESTGKWKDGYARSVVLNEATIAYNHGTTLVADTNTLNLLVSDGEDFDEPCKEANGQVWTPEYAREHLQEHPNCRRGFVPTQAAATTS